MSNKYTPQSLLLLLTLTFSLICSAQQSGLDYFDDHELGPIASQSPNWITWSGGMNTAEDAEVVSDVNHTAPNSLAIIGLNDIVYALDPYFLEYDSVDIEFRLFIPAGEQAYLHFASSYDGHNSGGLTAYGIYFNDEGLLPGVASHSGFQFNYPEDQWFRLNLRMSTADDQGIAYGNIFLFDEIVASVSMFPPKSIDFFAIDEQSAWYIDDLEWETFDLTTGIVENEISSLSVYPNPSNGNVSIRTDEFQGAGSITLHSLDGKLISSIQVNNLLQNELDLSEVDAGLYLLSIERLKDGLSSTVRLAIE